MSKKIKKIALVFENCESVDLLPDEFYGLYIQGIKDNYLINCFQYENGEIIKQKQCEKFNLVLNKKGENKKVEMADISLLQRLKQWKDITWINIYYKNGKDDSIAVPWGGDNEKNNKQILKELNDDTKIIIK